MRKAKPIIFLLMLSFAAAAYGAALRRVAIVDLPGDPGFNGIAMAAGNVVISRPATNTIEIFSPVKRRVVARISQVQGPRGITVDDEGARVYVALSGSDSVAVINSHNWQVEKLIQVQQQPENLLWVPQTKALYVTSSLNRSVSTVNPLTGRETNVIQMNALPEDMVYDPAHQHLLVSLQDVRQIGVIDVSNDRVINRFNLMASEPTGLALDSARNLLYVAVRYAVVALNLENGSEAYRIPAPGGTDTLVLDPDGNLLYAAGGDGSVLAIDLNRKIVDHELPTDVKGFSIAYDPQRHMLFMPGARDGRSKMVILKPISMNNDQNRSQTAENPPGGPQTAMRK